MKLVVPRPIAAPKPALLNAAHHSVDATGPLTLNYALLAVALAKASPTLPSRVPPLPKSATGELEVSLEPRVSAKSARTKDSYGSSKCTPERRPKRSSAVSLRQDITPSYWYRRRLRALWKLHRVTPTGSGVHVQRPELPGKGSW